MILSAEEELIKGLLAEIDELESELAMAKAKDRANRSVIEAVIRRAERAEFELMRLKRNL